MPEAELEEHAPAGAPKRRAPVRRRKVEAAPEQPSIVAISVVIPAYNEAERIAPTLVEAHAYFSKFGEPFEIIVSDDGSTDRTPEIVERMSGDIRQLKLVRAGANEGKGAAVARGMLSAAGQVRLFADADGSTPFDQFEKLADAIASGAQVAIGSRAMPDSILDPAQPLPRVLLGKLSNLVIQATNLPGIRDTQCGFKLYTASAAEKIFPHLTAKRWGFDVEALVIARGLGLRVSEIGVVWRDREGTTLRPGAYLQTFWEDLRIRYNALRGAYPKW